MNIPVLSLDSPRWSELQHAYGDATDVPALLRQLESLPEPKGEDEPWYSLWSALAHQGDVYSASFAAVPHVIAAFAKAPERAGNVYLHFPAWVEICRQQKAVEIPDDLEFAYKKALEAIPSLISAASRRRWDGEFLASALSVLAAVKGHSTVAEAAIELTPAVATDFLTWFHER
jgi:hypothetical protein